jgi:hypothetical protein
MSPFRACPDCSGYGGCAYGLCNLPVQLAAHDRVEKGALVNTAVYFVAGVETGKGVPLDGGSLLAVPA